MTFFALTPLDLEEITIFLPWPISHISKKPTISPSPWVLALANQQGHLQFPGRGGWYWCWDNYLNLNIKNFISIYVSMLFSHINKRIHYPLWSSMIWYDMICSCVALPGRSMGESRSTWRYLKNHDSRKTTTKLIPQSRLLDFLDVQTPPPNRVDRIDICWGHPKKQLHGMLTMMPQGCSKVWFSLFIFQAKIVCGIQRFQATQWDG